MKTWIKAGTRTLVLVIAIMCGGSIAYSQSNALTVMSYNLRYDEPRDSADNWHLRKAELAAQVKHYAPDILGIQEGLLRQLMYLDSSLVTYGRVGAGRDDGKEAGEFSALFYNSLKLEKLESGTFWLSPTPDVPSKGWDAALPRVCTFALLKDKATGKRFWAFNTHFDHMGKEARKQSAALILEEIRRKNRQNHPVVLMGDLNSAADEPPVRAIIKKMKDTGNTKKADNRPDLGTFNGFGRDTSGRRIDYIFVKKFKAGAYERPSELRANGRFISDHYPVWARLHF